MKHKATPMSFESVFRKMANKARERKAERAWKELRGLTRLKMRVIPKAFIEEESSGALQSHNYREESEKSAPKQRRRHTAGLMKKRYGG